MAFEPQAGPPLAALPQDSPNGEPPECFGFQMNSMMEDSILDPEDVRRCYTCPAFDRCNRLSSVRALQQLKFELRRSTRGVRESLGGAHSQRPFW